MYVHVHVYTHGNGHVELTDDFEAVWTERGAPSETEVAQHWTMCVEQFLQSHLRQTGREGEREGRRGEGKRERGRKREREKEREKERSTLTTAQVSILIIHTCTQHPPLAQG